MKGRLGRLEQAASEHFTIVTCPECGFEVRYPGDLALDTVVASWARVAECEEAARHVEPSTVTLVLEHAHRALVDEVLTDLPAFGRAR